MFIFYLLNYFSLSENMFIRWKFNLSDAADMIREKNHYEKKLKENEILKN